MNMGVGANFRSDNTAGAAPEILEAIVEAGRGPAAAYGADPWTVRLTQRLTEMFDCELDVFPVVSGTAANALALACMTPPYGAVFVHANGHVNTDECAAPEFFTGGAKLIALDGEHGKLDAARLAERLHVAQRGVHWAPRAAVSISQATEAGTIYSADEVAALGELCRAHGLKLHMDGARFANVLVGQATTPAAMTWRAGVAALSFGATKSGALAAEAVILFDRTLAADLAFRQKRAGHLLSKMRFISAQLLAYLRDDLWLAHARRATDAARQLEVKLRALAGVALLHPVEANILFVALPPAVADGLEADGHQFYRWPASQYRTVIRLVTSFATTEAEIAAFLGSLVRHLAARP